MGSNITASWGAGARPWRTAQSMENQLLIGGRIDMERGIFVTPES